MTQTTQQLSCDDESKIADFLDHYIHQTCSMPACPVYHYTTGESFIKIIQSGELWATQAACLNDTTELTYATEEIRKRVNAKLCGSHNPAIKPVLTWISEALSNPGPEVSPVFVTCFSEQRDSLSQWRPPTNQHTEATIPIRCQPFNLMAKANATGPLLASFPCHPTD